MDEWFKGVVAATQNNPQTAAQAELSATARFIDISMQDAAAFVGAQASTPWRSDGSIGLLAYRYSQTDPAAAAQWIASLPPTNGAYVGVKELVQNWSQSDSDAFQQWLGAQQGALFKQAVNQYLRVLGDKSPEIAAQWKQRLNVTPQ